MLTEEKANLAQNPELFGTASVDYLGVNLNFFSLEHSPTLPENWLESVTEAIAAADIVVPEYFAPELEQTVFRTPLLGKLARNYARSSIQPVFGEIERICADLNKQVAVVDIANNVNYLWQEIGTQLKLGLNFRKAAEKHADLGAEEYIYADHTGGLAPITEYEQSLHTPIDARRLISAVGMIRLAEVSAQGSNILYLAPYAHTKRVLNYTLRHFVLQNGDLSDQKKLDTYLGWNWIPKSVRMYQHEQGRWHKYDELNLRP